MAVELGKFIQNQLDSLPSDHPDRGYLEGLLTATKSYIERARLGRVAVFDSVEQAVKEYQSKLRTPELVTKFHQTIWQARGETVGLTFEVSPCPYTQEELTTLEQQGKRVGYLPMELTTQQSRNILGKMFPQIKSDSVQEGNTVTNDENPSGWFDYETKIDAPYLDTDEKQLTERIVKDKRKILNLNQYIVAGQDSKLLTGRYLDEEKTWTRLGSRPEGRVVYASFYRDGHLYVSWLLSSVSHYQLLGGRSSGVKKLKTLIL